jgi:hypothetical protein
MQGLFVAMFAELHQFQTNAGTGFVTARGVIPIQADGARQDHVFTFFGHAETPSVA